MGQIVHIVSDYYYSLSFFIIVFIIIVFIIISIVIIIIIYYRYYCHLLCIGFFFWTLHDADCAQFPVLTQKCKKLRRIEIEEKPFEQLAQINGVISYHLSFFYVTTLMAYQGKLALKVGGLYCFV